jgi:catechol 2,3-dioxygenase-like lactoylglutathione lyase family enzyme
MTGATRGGTTVKFLSVMPNLYVADVEASAAFYRDLLGGTETFRTATGHVLGHHRASGRRLHGRPPGHPGARRLTVSR